MYMIDFACHHACVPAMLDLCKGRSCFAGRISRSGLEALPALPLSKANTNKYSHYYSAPLVFHLSYRKGKNYDTARVRSIPPRICS